MRRMSAERRQQLVDNQPEREAFRLEFPKCMVPWCLRPALEVHEIARGPARKQAVGERCTWLHVCRLCHTDMGQYSRWPLVRQYALKALADRAYYDRLRLNELRGRAPNAISEREVLQAAAELFLGGLSLQVDWSFLRQKPQEVVT